MDAVLFVKRMTEGGDLYVFVYRNSHNRDGLDPDMLGKVNRFMRESFEKRLLSILHRCFEAEIGRQHGILPKVKSAFAVEWKSPD